jgi:hypothetical protein
MANQGKMVMIFALGIYRTRAAAEAAIGLWADVYGEDALSIDFDGTSYRLIVNLPDDAE